MHILQEVQKRFLLLFGKLVPDPKELSLFLFLKKTGSSQSERKFKMSIPKASHTASMDVNVGMAWDSRQRLKTLRERPVRLEISYQLSPFCSRRCDGD